MGKKKEHEEKVIEIETADTVPGQTQEPNESLFGSALLFTLSLALLAVTGYFGYSGYKFYRLAQSEKAIPSIEGIVQPAEPMSEVPAPAAEIPAPSKPEQPVPEAPTIDKKAMVVKVLNGGAAKGSASTFTETLKKAGYASATFGNSFGNYTGVTVYYGAGRKAEGEALVVDVQKTYPKAVAKEAPQGDRDAAAAAFVVILGK
jgi:hypothetical protein